MRDPFTWSLPLGRVVGITVRVHILFIVFVAAMWLRTVFGKDFPEGAAAAMLLLMLFVFISVLLHEFGHCFAARSVDGDAEEILMWPLGGLAYCDVPHTPRANFITTAGGPAVNMVLCLIAAAALLSHSLMPPLIPLPQNAFYCKMWNFAAAEYVGSQFAPPLAADAFWGVSRRLPDWHWQFLVGQFFWVNWFLFLLNIVLVGFPLDGGRLLQATLWARMGYRRSMWVAVIAGFVIVFVVGLFGLIANEVLWFCLAGFVYFACRHEWKGLVEGHEETLFGYDFSQGYTSLEREEKPKLKKKRQNFVQRWLQQRAQRKLQRELEQRAAEESRMDELLDKIHRKGKDSLTEEEHRFLKRVSDRYGNKK